MHRQNSILRDGVKGLKNFANEPKKRDSMINIAAFSIWTVRLLSEKRL